MLDFRIDTFLTVCKWGSYTKAAKELCITQPAVSQHIHFLEERYGARLFSYEGKKLALTEAGKILYNGMATMKHDVLQLREQMQQLAVIRRPLHFGATMTIGEFSLPENLLAYLKRHPQTAYHMTLSNTADLLQKIDSGEIDFAFVEGYFEKEAYDFFVYSRESYIAVAASAHPLAREQKLTLPRLFDNTLILREEGSGTREIFERVLKMRNLGLPDFAGYMEINNMNVIKRFVREEKGITFLYRAAVEEELADGSLIQLPLEDFDVQHDFYFVWRKNSIFSGDYRTLFEELINPPGAVPS